MRYVGIDVSKDELIVAYLDFPGTYKLSSFGNTGAGISKFIKTLCQETDHCILEATGTYSYLLTHQLATRQYRLSVVNPLRIKHFANMMLSVTKTDLKDAKLIALFGQRMQPEQYELPQQVLLELKHKRALYRQLKKQYVALLNTRHAHEKSPYVDKSTGKILNKCMVNLEKQLKKLKQEMIQVVEIEYERLLQKVTSVAGIGKQVGAALIEITNGFKNFSSAKKFARFIGLCPTIFQSGKSLKIQGRIARSGDPDLRALLYMCAVTAIRYNQACKAFYLHLKERGKASKLALVAVANKLLRQVFAIVKQDQEYIDGYVASPRLT